MTLLGSRSSVEPVMTVSVGGILYRDPFFYNAKVFSIASNP